MAALASGITLLVLAISPASDTATNKGNGIALARESAQSEEPVGANFRTPSELPPVIRVQEMRPEEGSLIVDEVYMRVHSDGTISHRTVIHSGSKNSKTHRIRFNDSDATYMAVPYTPVRPSGGVPADLMRRESDKYYHLLGGGKVPAVNYGLNSVRTAGFQVDYLAPTNSSLDQNSVGSTTAEMTFEWDGSSVSLSSHTHPTTCIASTVTLWVPGTMATTESTNWNHAYSSPYCLHDEPATIGGNRIDFVFKHAVYNFNWGNDEVETIAKTWNIIQGFSDGSNNCIADNLSTGEFVVFLGLGESCWP